MRKTILAFFLFLPVAAHASYARCVLDSVPGVKNNQALQAALRVCSNKYPEGLYAIKPGSGKGWLAPYNNPDECLADKAKDTSLNQAVNHIRFACTRLYGEPEPAAEQIPPGFKPYRGNPDDIVPLDSAPSQGVRQ